MLGFQEGKYAFGLLKSQIDIIKGGVKRQKEREEKEHCRILDSVLAMPLATRRLISNVGLRVLRL